MIILGVPILDVVFSFFRRLIKRQHWHQADAGHLHHRLMRLGHGPRRTVAMLWAWTALLSAVALVPTYTKEGNAIVPFVVAGLALLLFAVFHPGANRDRRQRERGEHPSGGSGGLRAAMPSSTSTSAAASEPDRTMSVRGATGSAPGRDCDHETFSGKIRRSV